MIGRWRFPPKTSSSTRSHVRSFTQHPSSNVRHPGTYAGFREKIPYLKSLGINCLELMPIFEFDEFENSPAIPRLAKLATTTGATARSASSPPRPAIAATGPLGMQADEFKNARERAAQERHRSDARRGVQPHGRGRPARPDDFLPRVGQPHLLHAHAGRVLLQLQRLRQHAQLQQPGRAATGARLPAVLGFRVPHRRVPVRSGRDPRARPERGAAGQPAAAGIAGQRSGARPLQTGGRGVGRRRAVPGRLVSRRTAAGPSGTASTATRSASSSRATWARWPICPLRLQGSPDLYYGRGTAASVNFITCHDGFTLVRPRCLQRQTQRSQRRTQQRRRQRQQQLELRLGRRDGRSASVNASAPADEERRRDAAC